MSETQSQGPQPCALHHGAPQQTAPQDLLLICCKVLDWSREATAMHRDSSSKTMGLEMLSPIISTCAREIC